MATGSSTGYHRTHEEVQGAGEVQGRGITEGFQEEVRPVERCRSKGLAERREKQRGGHQVCRGGQERRGAGVCPLAARVTTRTAVKLIQGAEAAGGGYGPRGSLNFTVSQVTGHSAWTIGSTS